jgi:SAM-dependent methyltransferase
MSALKNSLSRKIRRLALLTARLTGVTIVRTKDRDAILDSAPWLAPYFLLPEKIETPKTTAQHHDAYLRWDNPRLTEFRKRYMGHPAADHVQWGNPDVEQLDLEFFRADNLYVFQGRRYPSSIFYATAAYAKEIDHLNLLARLGEDSCFGAETFDFHGQTISRDLLDSIIEINFLHTYCPALQKANLNVLDIGSGYGRLAHRMVEALPNIGRYHCVDAVSVSTFLCEYYLEFRKVMDRCAVIPLDAFAQLKSVPIDLAINVHSFQECRSSVIKWWLHRLAEMRVPWLFIVVGSNLGLTSNEGRGVRKDFQPLVENAGYKLAIKKDKFNQAPVLQRYGLYPADYFLFQRI